MKIKMIASDMDDTIMSGKYLRVTLLLLKEH